MSLMVKHIHAHAKANGLAIIEPRHDVLQLDLDDRFAVQAYKKQLPILREFHNIIAIHETTSKSGNTHVYIKLDTPITVQEAIAIQCCLGSDAKRELLTLRNVAIGRELPMFLYETEAVASTIPAEFKPAIEVVEVAA